MEVENAMPPGYYIDAVGGEGRWIVVFGDEADDLLGSGDAEGCAFVRHSFFQSVCGSCL